MSESQPSTKTNEQPLPPAHIGSDTCEHVGPGQKKPLPDPRSGKLHRGRSEIYGSFFIDDTEFAIPVAAVQEVVNEPEVVSPIPLSPPFMLGLFNLRGMIIPVVDLRIMFDFPKSVNEGNRKVAIIEHGNQCVGILFCRTGEILSQASAARVEFQPREDGIKDSVVEGVLKFDEGNRLVQVLDPYRILKIKKLPNLKNLESQPDDRTERGDRRNCISFQMGHTSCAIDLRYVREVREMYNIDRTLLAHEHILGTTSLRGVILPVIDFRGFMGDGSSFNPDKSVLKDRRMLVLETIEGPIGLMVFSIDNIMRYYDDEVLPFAKLALPKGEFVSGCLIDSANRIVMMLNPDMLMAEPSFVTAARSCHEIYPPETTDDADTGQAHGGARRTFIQFTFDKKFALDTATVSEVIDRPSDIMEPPYSLEFVEGIINLRGELITLLNPRLLYGLPASDAEGQKVLIFKHSDRKYALLVDSVDGIIMTTENKVTDIKPMEFRNTVRNVSEDVNGCVQSVSRDGSTSSVLILDVAALVERSVNAQA